MLFHQNKNAVSSSFQSVIEHYPKIRNNRAVLSHISFIILHDSFNYHCKQNVFLAIKVHILKSESIKSAESVPRKFIILCAYRFTTIVISFFSHERSSLSPWNNLEMKSLMCVCNIWVSSLPLRLPVTAHSTTSATLVMQNLSLKLYPKI